MVRRKNEFREEDKNRTLLWCARHCCLCGRFVGVGIEVAHLDPKKSDIDNAIPLCFDCHAAIGHYNSKHARGRKYSIAELRSRRDQIYDQHTQHLVSPVTYKLTQPGATFPRVVFEIQNIGQTYPVRARVKVRLYHADRDLGHPPSRGHYDGRYLLNLNPQQGFRGNFEVPPDVPSSSTDPLRARVDIALLDIYEREHRLLPQGYILPLDGSSDWYFEPAEEELRVSPRTDAGDG